MMASKRQDAEQQGGEQPEDWRLPGGEQDVEFVEYGEIGGSADLYVALRWSDYGPDPLGSFVAENDQKARESVPERFGAEHDVAALEARDADGKLLRYVPVETHLFAFVPPADQAVFPVLHREALERDVKASYAHLGEGRAYRVPVADLHRLPTDDFGPYLGTIDHGYSLAPYFFLDPADLFWVPVRPRTLLNQAAERDLGLD